MSYIYKDPTEPFLLDPESTIKTPPGIEPLSPYHIRYQQYCVNKFQKRRKILDSIGPKAYKWLQRKNGWNNILNGEYMEMQHCLYYASQNELELRNQFPLAPEVDGTATFAFCLQQMVDHNFLFDTPTTETLDFVFASRLAQLGILQKSIYLYETPIQNCFETTAFVNGYDCVINLGFRTSSTSINPDYLEIKFGDHQSFSEQNTNTTM